MIKKKYTDQDILTSAHRYTSIAEWAKAEPALYRAALRRKALYALCMEHIKAIQHCVEKSIDPLFYDFVRHHKSSCLTRYQDKMPKSKIHKTKKKSTAPLSLPVGQGNAIKSGGASHDQ